MSRVRTALSLYVALGVHALAALVVAMGGVSPQLPEGAGQGLGGGGDAPLADVVPPDQALPRSDADTHDETLPSDAVQPLRLAAAPVVVSGAEPARARRVADRAGSVAPDSATPGAGKGAGGGRGGYAVQIRRQLDRNRRALPGTLGAGSSEVGFTVDAHGAVSDLQLTLPSGIAALDDEALAVVRRAQPFPPPPDGQPRRLRVPISIDAVR